MKQTQKRMLSLLLVVCMLLSVMVPAVFAEDAVELVYDFTLGTQLAKMSAGTGASNTAKSKAIDVSDYLQIDEAYWPKDPTDAEKKIKPNWDYMGRSINAYATVSFYASASGMRLFDYGKGTAEMGCWYAIKLNDVPAGEYSVKFTLPDKACNTTDVYVMPASTYTSSAANILYENTGTDKVFGKGAVPTDANGKTIIELMDELLATQTKLITLDAKKSGDGTTTQTAANIPLSGDAGNDYVLVFKMQDPDPATAESQASLYLKSVTLTKTGEVEKENTQRVYSFYSTTQYTMDVNAARYKKNDANLLNNGPFPQGGETTWDYMARSVSNGTLVNLYTMKEDGTTGLRLQGTKGAVEAGGWVAIRLNDIPAGVYEMEFKSEKQNNSSAKNHASDIYLMPASVFKDSAAYKLYSNGIDPEKMYSGTSFPTDESGKTIMELMGTLLKDSRVTKVTTEEQPYQVAPGESDTFGNIAISGDAGNDYVLVFQLRDPDPDTDSSTAYMFLSYLTMTKTGEAKNEKAYSFYSSTGDTVGHKVVNEAKTKANDAALFGEGSKSTWQYMGRSINMYARANVYKLREDGTTNGIKFSTESSAEGKGAWFAIKLNNVAPALYSMVFSTDDKAVTATDVYVMPASVFKDSAAYNLYDKTPEATAFSGGSFPTDKSGKTIIQLMDELLATDAVKKAGTYELTTAGGTVTLENVEFNGDAGNDYVLVFKDPGAAEQPMNMYMSSLTLSQTGTVIPSGGAGGDDSEEEEDEDEDNKLSINTILQRVELTNSTLAEFEVGGNDFIATSVVNGHDYLYVAHNTKFFVYDLDTWEKVDEQWMGWQESDGAFVDSEGIVWVYGQNSYMFRYDPKTKAFTQTPKASINNKAPWVMANPFELDGKIYFATWGKEPHVISYDPATKTYEPVVNLTSVPGMYEGAEKANGMAYKDGYIYVSVHAATAQQAPHYIVKVDLATGQVVGGVDLGVRGVYGVTFDGYLKSMRIVGDVLLGAANNQKSMIAVDINTMELIDVGHEGGIVHSISEVITEADGNEKVYFFARPYEEKDGSKRYLCEYNSSTRKVTKVEGFEEPTTYQLNTQQTAFATIEKEGLTGKSLFLMKKDGTMVLFNLESKRTVELPGLTYGDGAGISLLEFELGPAGSNEIYLGAFMCNQVGIYNYEKNEMTEIYGAYSNQIETIARDGDKLYVSGYGACSIIEMDYNTGEYKLLFALNEEHMMNLVQERIQNITFGDNKVFASTVPQKGLKGGFIVWYDYEKETTFVIVEEDKVIYLKDSDKSTWYDAKTNEKVVFNTDDLGANDFKGAISDQIVNAIHYSDGYLYGVTNIFDAEGSEHAADNTTAVIFAFDVEKMEMVTYDISEGIDGLTLPVEMISIFNPDPEVEGKFWGVVAQTLFTATYDKENKTFNVEEILSFGKDSYRTYGNNFKNGDMYIKDGYMLVNFRTKDSTPGSYASDNLRIICLDDPEYNFCLYASACKRYALGDDDNIYFAHGAIIYKLESAEIIKTIKTMKVNSDAVQAQIDAIGTVTLASKDAVAAVRAAYDALTDDEKKLVEEELLVAAEAAIAALEQATDADKAAADAVQKQIDAIGTVTLESEAAITAARTAYDALTVLQKAMVRVDVLVAAETALADLKAAAEQAVADKAAADPVQALIDAIGTVTLESEDAITAARTAYNALTVAQKKLVDATALKAAEAKLADLKQAVVDQAAADAAKALIDAIGTVTLESEAAIKAARDAYNMLTIAQRALVDVTVLEAAEAAYDALVNPKTGDTMPVGLVMAVVLVSAMAMTVMLVPDIRKKLVR